MLLLLLPPLPDTGQVGESISKSTRKKDPHSLLLHPLSFVNMWVPGIIMARPQQRCQ